MIGRWWLGAALALASVGPAEAQRELGGAVYDQGLEELIPGAREFLERLEQQGWLLRGQSTVAVQARPRIRSRYRGENSLSPAPAWNSTQSLDFILGRALWSGAEVIAVPSVIRGAGLSDARGVAAGISQEAFHSGSASFGFSLARLFVRQTIDISFDAFGSDDDPTRFAGPLALQRVTLTAGKIAAWDFFDNNRYAHDPRGQFMSWALVGTGAFDIAGDAGGLTHGAVVEWENGPWAVRAGAFQVARSQGSDFLDENIGRGLQGLLQVDRFWWRGRYRGAVRVLGGASRQRSARYNDLTRALGDPDAELERLRAYRTKGMLALNWEQQWNDSIGTFGRLGWNDGRTQSWMVTEMDWSASLGVAVNGWSWERFSDTVGLAVNVGGLQAPHRRFYENGGIGFVLGDGRLRYAPEVLFEAYYNAEFAPGLTGGVGAQLIVNPGFNADRGPVPVGMLRLRAAF